MQTLYTVQWLDDDGVWRMFPISSDTIDGIRFFVDVNDAARLAAVRMEISEGRQHYRSKFPAHHVAKAYRAARYDFVEPEENPT